MIDFFQGAFAFDQNVKLGSKRKFIYSLCKA